MLRRYRLDLDRGGGVREDPPADGVTDVGHGAGHASRRGSHLRGSVPRRDLSMTYGAENKGSWGADTGHPDGHPVVHWRTNRRLDLRLYVERVTRIELALSAWEADVLPLNYTRRVLRAAYRSASSEGSGGPPERMTTVVPAGLGIALMCPTALISIEPRPRSMLGTRSRHRP